jgi:hypothetical protein
MAFGFKRRKRIVSTIDIDRLPKMVKYLKRVKNNDTIRVLFLFLIIVPSTLGLYFLLAVTIRVGDKPPQLLIIDGTGINGIPDLAVSFWTKEKTQNTVWWGVNSLTQEITEEKPCNEHAFILSNLHPSTEYWYRINDGEVIKFKTPNSILNNIKFACASDSHFGHPKTNKEVISQMLGHITNEQYGSDMFFFLVTSFIGGQTIGIGKKDLIQSHLIPLKFHSDRFWEITMIFLQARSYITIISIPMQSRLEQEQNRFTGSMSMAFTS